MSTPDTATPQPVADGAAKAVAEPDPGDLDTALDRVSEDAAVDEQPMEQGPRRRVLMTLGLVGAVVFLWMLFRPIPREDPGAAPPSPSSADAVDRMATETDPGWMRSADTMRITPRSAPVIPPVYQPGVPGNPGPQEGVVPPTDSAAAAAPGPAAPTPQNADPRREAFHAALKSKPLGSADAAFASAPNPGASASPIAAGPGYEELAAAAESEAVARTQGGIRAGVGDTARVAAAPVSSYLGGTPTDPRRLAPPARLLPRMPAGPDSATLPIGTVIDGHLAMPINTDIPGGAIGVISRPVYDGSLRRVVIPAGSWLYGTYESAIAPGQRRVVLEWTAIRFPDGRTYELPAVRAGDGTGASGIPGRVNNHYGRVFGHAVLASVISAGFTSSAPAGAEPSRRGAMADAAASQLGETAARVTDRDLSIKPTIWVPRLTPFTIILDRELTFVPPER